jgi:hypothetical protein
VCLSICADSVLYPILWKRCFEIGIGGRFLSTLQALCDDGPSAVLEVDGELQPSVPIECGVLQGNALSPLLFNIYFDAVVRSVHEYGKMQMLKPDGDPIGVLLPMCVEPFELLNQDNYLPSL